MNKLQYSKIDDLAVLTVALSDGEMNQEPSPQTTAIKMSGITYSKSKKGCHHWGVFRDEQPYMLIQRIHDPFKNERDVGKIVDQFFGTGRAYFKISGEARGFGRVLICAMYDEKALEIVKIAAFPTAWHTNKLAATFAYMSIEIDAQDGMDRARKELTAKSA